MTEVDALIIGAGYYGCRLALALRQNGFERVVIVEREAGIMRRASFVNQARVHNGYHYPRSPATAISSRLNYRRFVEDHRFAIVEGVSMKYAIARNSRVSPAQFERFCGEIGAECRTDALAKRQLFDASEVDECFAVDELAFDAVAIAGDIAAKLAQAGVKVLVSCSAETVRHDDRGVTVSTTSGTFRTRHLLNCTYAGLDALGIPIGNAIKKEVAEIAMIVPPSALEGLAVTVMDGPYFSTMPFPALGCYSLTHVRYTPHEAYLEPLPGQVVPGPPRAGAMIRDAGRFMPMMAAAKYLHSLFELKAILVHSEQSDARPIVFEQSPVSDRIHSVLGSKIDNVYDVLDVVARKSWS